MSAESLAGKVMLVTGSTDGIGKETAFALARRGATVILHGRDLGRCQRTLNEAVRLTRSKTLGCFAADLASLHEVRRLAEDIAAQYNRLDVLINNAGVFMTSRVLSADGYEMTFAVNHLAPFLLTHLLLDRLKASAPSRIIMLGSVAHQRARLDLDDLQGERQFTGYGAYALSKLGTVLFTFELAERLRGSGVGVLCLHPGVIGTKLLRGGFGGMSGGSVKQGAETVMYLATAPELDRVTGQYFIERREGEPTPLAHDVAVRRRFWDVSARLCGMGGGS
jgi:NAD(P)-dependent dehydrogenase (short-subunit alcohol dehydrogenase family)